LLPAKSQNEPTFLIERIRIEDAKHVTPAILIAEARLKEGESYREIELKRAANRILRLPFVLDASFSLEKGSRKDHYVLVIRIQETRTYFFSIATDYHENSGDFSDQLSLGARWFVGTSGVLFLNASPPWTWAQEPDNPEQYAIGYSQYDLFNRNIFANLTLRFVPSEASGFDASGYQVRFASDAVYQPELNLGVPLRGNHWLKFRSTYGAVKNSTEEIRSDGDVLLSLARSEREVDYGEYRLYWSYDSRNDNFLPTAGQLVESGVHFGTSDTARRFEGVNIEPMEGSSFEKTDYWSLFAIHQRYREVGSRHSYNYGAELHWATFDSTSSGTFIGSSSSETRRVIGNLGYSYDLWGRNRTRKHGDFRFSANMRHQDQYSESGSFSSSFNDTLLQLDVHFRNSWGIIRAGYRHAFD
jgi:hypothetical protein